MKDTAWAWIEDNKERLIEISDEIWGYAELGLVEEKSAKLLADELESHGFNVERGVCPRPSMESGEAASP
jgi:aminobenzoyl-glutamate utilization protein B